MGHYIVVLLMLLHCFNSGLLERDHTTQTLIFSHFPVTACEVMLNSMFNR